MDNVSTEKYTARPNEEIIIGEAQEEYGILASKAATFGAIQAGDCRIEDGAELTYFDDGSLSWKCDISSGDTNDVWVGYFHFFNKDGVELFKSTVYQFKIRDKDKKKRWAENRGPNPDYARYYQETTTVEFQCEC